MRISFTARHGKAPEETRQYAENAVKRLKKYYDGIIDCDIILDYEKLMKVAEINISVYGTLLSSIEKTEDINKSINQAVDKLERQLEKYKNRKRNRPHTRIKEVMKSDDSSTIEE